MVFFSKYYLIVKDYLKSHLQYVKIFSACLTFIIIILLLFLAPSLKKSEHNVNIESGLSLMQVSSLMKQNHIIRSGVVFRAVVILMGGESKIKAGPYLFSGTENVLIVSRRIIKADYGVPVKKITIIEGMRGKDLVNLFDGDFPNLDKAVFEKEVLKREGYLFPDTYFIPLEATSDDVIKMLSDNFEQQLSKIDLSKSTTSKDLKQIITTASIIEGEAKEDADRKIVADILWRRLNMNMLLQVDTTFMYINGKASSELTKKDLSIDSPYNTYVNKGLPPTPINNPGLEAINSVMFPTPNKYVYYLSDKNGVMHYAVTFAEHKKNIEKYLR